MQGRGGLCGNLGECEDELRSRIGSWTVFKLGYEVPVIPLTSE